ncbi:unnamed protein product [Porites lobata]|uniref:UBA domain-containing protein n=1 Tax=Porites lobata TaxID=104759 RepID=A0ABN8SAG6_9CNID|nr:unnamed protein product [Porites lobata]
MREFAGEEQVEVIVTIDEEEYEKVWTELIKMNEAKGRDEWQEKFGYILSYLEQPKDYSDSPSTTTETSDSGMPRPHSGAASELGSEEISAVSSLDSSVPESIQRLMATGFSQCKTNLNTRASYAVVLLMSSRERDSHFKQHSCPKYKLFFN